MSEANYWTHKKNHRFVMQWWISLKWTEILDKVSKRWHILVHAIVHFDFKLCKLHFSSITLHSIFASSHNTCGWYHAIFSKSKCRIRIFPRPLPFTNIPYFCRLYICVCEVSPANAWTNADLWSISPPGTNFRKIWITDKYSLGSVTSYGVINIGQHWCK